MILESVRRGGVIIRGALNPRESGGRWVRVSRERCWIGPDPTLLFRDPAKIPSPTCDLSVPRSSLPVVVVVVESRRLILSLCHITQQSKLRRFRSIIPRRCDVSITNWFGEILERGKGGRGEGEGGEIARNVRDIAYRRGDRSTGRRNAFLRRAPLCSSSSKRVWYGSTNQGSGRRDTGRGRTDGRTGRARRRKTVVRLAMIERAAPLSSHRYYMRAVTSPLLPRRWQERNSDINDRTIAARGSRYSQFALYIYYASDILNSAPRARPRVRARLSPSDLFAH